MLWPYGTTLYSEAWLTAAFVWAAWALLDARQGRSILARPRPHRVGAARGGWAHQANCARHRSGFHRRGPLRYPPDRRVRWRSAVTLGVGIALAAAAQIGWNLVRFGRPLDFGYNLAGMIPILPARSFAPEDVPRGLLVQLLTPGKSLFVWAPVTLVSVLTIRDWWSRERGIGAGLLTGTALAVMFYAAFLYPEGGYAHGPRHLLPLVPLLMLPLAMPGVGVPRRALVTATVAGFIIAALAASVRFSKISLRHSQARRRAVRTTSGSIRRRDGRGTGTGSTTSRSRRRSRAALVVGGSTGWQRARYLRAASRAARERRCLAAPRFLPGYPGRSHFRGSRC